MRYQVFGEGYVFLSFDKNMGSNICKNISKILVNTVRTSLIMLQKLPQMHLKLLQKEAFKKQQKQLAI